MVKMKVISFFIVTVLIASTCLAGDLFTESMLNPIQQMQINSVMVDRLSMVQPLQMGNARASYQLEKSKGKAMLLSMLIPGAGQWYLGHKNWARAFFVTEVALWTGAISFDAYSKWRRDDMKTFAALHAHADINDKPSQYFVDMGNYIDIYEYNDAKQLRREFQKVYDVDEYFWAWGSDVQQHDFEQMRISSDRARNRAIFMVGGIIANHLFSAIDAVWKTYRYNKKFHATGPPVSFHFATRPTGEWRFVVNTVF